MSNRRNYERLLIQKFAILKLANGETIQGQTRDLGMGGAFIECAPDIHLEEGTECTISLVLNDEEERMITEIYGCISHCDNSGGLGCNFLKINATYYQFIGEASD
ncbi:PilZ domain-containing protein [Desulfocapsa sulfexigens DSM 10523]|uniref:PilZ domain-containing protein n=1 Tax=Desulfocapsa sulfexigens (strain DSM 10523 / SB164P1) TaxID=1167006 RepID=M1PJE4_DESSD|nr:PilZ domain-containing protein [Desulfocapsa sulfexigens]AGF76616.1 PilZ domain-containing protein [Desulfocapsa sulfexigens DSM 10523]